MSAWQQKIAARKLLMRSLVIITSVYCTAGADSPINVVGYVGGEVVMECIRNSSGEVMWTYMPPGQSDTEMPIPGLYVKETSNSGIHRLTLKDLQLASAGTYICRSADKPPAFDRAGAYVVVITHKPYCENSLTVSAVATDDVVKLTCWVHYVASTDVRLEMSWIDPDGLVLNRNNFTTAATGTSSSSLSVSVRQCPPYLMPHHCAISFHTVTTYTDMAVNLPSVTSGRCQSPVTRLPVTSSGADKNCSAYANVSSVANGTNTTHVLPEEQPSNGYSQYVTSIAIGTSVVVGLVGLAAIRVSIFYCRRRGACKRPLRLGDDETNSGEQTLAMCSTDAKLNTMSELCGSPSESSKKPDDSRPPDQPPTPGLVAADDGPPAVPDYTNQCTDGPVLAADERTPQQAFEDEAILHPDSEIENLDDHDDVVELRSEMDSNSAATSDVDDETDTMLPNSSTQLLTTK